MYAQTSRCPHNMGFDSEPLYTGLYNLRWPQTPEEYTLEMNVEVKALRLKILFSEPLPSLQHDLSPRQSHAAGTGLDEPRGPNAVTQENEQEEGIFPFQADVDGSLHVNCTSPEQEGTISFQADVVVKLEEKISTAQKSPHARSLQNC